DPKILLKSREPLPPTFLFLRYSVVKDQTQNSVPGSITIGFSPTRFAHAARLNVVQLADHKSEALRRQQRRRRRW
ncbi:hypothetical protein, partial [Aminobacter sp. J41]